MHRTSPLAELLGPAYRITQESKTPSVPIKSTTDGTWIPKIKKCLCACLLLIPIVAWTQEEPPDNLTWNHQCVIDETDCRVFLRMTWEPPFQKYTRLCDNRDMGLEDDDFAGCLREGQRILAEGMDLENVEDKAGVSIRRIDKVECLWLRNSTIDTFFENHTHPQHVIVQNFKLVDGRFVLQPPEK